MTLPDMSPGSQPAACVQRVFPANSEDFKWIPSDLPISDHSPFKIVLWLENKALYVIFPISWMVLLLKQGGKDHAVHDPELGG